MAHLSHRVGKRAWRGKLENITVGHGVSLLQWRSGGENTPTIRRPTLSCRHQLLQIALDVAGRVIAAKGFCDLTRRFRDRVGSTVKRRLRHGAIENIGLGAP